MFYAFCATQQYRTSWANYLCQMRCDGTQCGRGSRKYDQFGIGAITQFRGNMH